MAHQSLYRRYRPQRFSEVKGQDAVVGALRSGVADGRVGHAYLFSGPRGTGKTSTARILAKALNCTQLADGEPCGVCDSCVAITAGTSYDLQELDAASNNKVDDVRALIERVALGSPGRTKVYILDEVHMLSPGASNALLKTLEEPPDHVVFVLATTDPQKVLPTIRSRTQHFEFHLLPADRLDEHVRWVISDAGLDVDDAAVEHVLRAGGGSARDTLSALDQAAAGGVSTDGDHAEALTEAVVAVDTAAALVAVTAATVAGREPRVLGEATLAHLRDVFLHRMGGPLVHLSDTARSRVEGWAERISDRGVTRALEEVGEALLAMRQAADPRIPLEVALVRLTRIDVPAVEADGSPAYDELLARVERLERAAPAPTDAPTGGPDPAPLAAAAAPRAAASRPAASEQSDGDETAESAPRNRPSDVARAALAGRKGTPTPSPSRSGRPSPPSPPPPSPRRPPGKGADVDGALSPEPPSAETARLGDAARRPGQAETARSGDSAPRLGPKPRAEEVGGEDGGPGATPITEPADSRPSSEAATQSNPPKPPSDLARTWADQVVAGLRGMTKALLGAAPIVSAEVDRLTLALPNRATLDRAEPKRAEAETALSAALGRPARLALVVASDDGPSVGGSGRRRERASRAEPADDDAVDLDGLRDAPTRSRSGVERVTDAFPGAQVVDP